MLPGSVTVVTTYSWFFAVSLPSLGVIDGLQYQIKIIRCQKQNYNEEKTSSFCCSCPISSMHLDN